MSQAYKDAIAKNDAAIAAYELVRDAYRARQIGDDEFLAARKEYDAAMREFDAAYAAEQNT